MPLAAPHVSERLPCCVLAESRVIPTTLRSPYNMADDSAVEQVILQHPHTAHLIAFDDECDPLPSSTPTGPLVLYGFFSTLHTVNADNVGAAQASAYLLPWRGETVDRYDVRLLLDEQWVEGAVEERPTLGKRKRQSTQDAEVAEEGEDKKPRDDTDDDEDMPIDGDDRAKQREAPLRDELSSGEWEMTGLEWERYRDITSEHSQYDTEDDEDASSTVTRGAGRQWHYEYSEERQPAGPQKTEWGVEDEDVMPEPSPSTPRPSSPPPPPFTPSFSVPQHIQLVHNTSHLCHTSCIPRNLC